MSNIQQEVSLSLSDKFRNLRDKNNNLLKKGIPTLVPWNNLPLLSQNLPGLIPGELVCLLANTGVGKSKITRKLAINDIREYCIKKDIKLKIFLNSLEETEEKIVATFVNKEYKKKYKTTNDYYKIIGFREDVIPQEEIKKIDECLEIFNSKYNKILDISRNPNHLPFVNKVLKYLETVGTFYKDTKKEGIVTHSVTLKNVTNKTNFDRFVYNEPTIVVTVWDTIDKMRGNLSQKYEAINDYVHNWLNIQLGQKCGLYNFIVSQQLPQKESIEVNYKGKTILEKSKPSLDAIRTNKSIQESCTLILGIFNPMRLGVTNYEGYNLKDFENTYLSLMILKGREAKKNALKEIPIIADLSIDDFEELPLPKEKEKLERYYKS